VFCAIRESRVPYGSNGVECRADNERGWDENA